MTIFRGTAIVAALALLGGCQTPPKPTPIPKDLHVPDFARVPFELFSRANAVAIAQREWRVFGQPVLASDARDEDPGELGEKPERTAGLWQRIGEYWWLGIDADNPEHRWTGKHDAEGRVFPPEQDGRFAWSAAFVSYVMRSAGAGTRFPYSASHADYINAARRGTALLSAEAPEAYAPQPGDLICVGRGGAENLRFADLPARRFAGHCDIVVARGAGTLDAIGGNVQDAVTLKQVATTPDGKLAGADGIPIDPRFSWLAVIRVRYDGGGGSGCSADRPAPVTRMTIDITSPARMPDAAVSASTPARIGPRVWPEPNRKVMRPSTLAQPSAGTALRTNAVPALGGAITVAPNSKAESAMAGTDVLSSGSATPAAFTSRIIAIGQPPGSHARKRPQTNPATIEATPSAAQKPAICRSSAPSPRRNAMMKVM